MGDEPVRVQPLVLRQRAGIRKRLAQRPDAAVDVAEWPAVAGTVAGDDTVMVAIRDGQDRALLISRILTLAELD